MSERSRRERAVCVLLVLLFAFALYAAMCACSGVAPGAYPYPSYLLQAQAWLRGEVALEKNYDYLELAVYNGRYYVSFPPVPTVPMVLWTLIWGDDVPGGLFQKLYVAIACAVACAALLRARRDPDAPLRLDGEGGPLRLGADCAAWAVFLCFGSALLPISLVGAVWFEAQILAFLFAICALAAMDRDRPTLACLLYALAVGCRPFAVCLGPVLLALYLRRARGQSAGRKLRRLAPGLIAGLCVAACYAAYNYARFGDIFEFGHNYLPEFQREGQTQFSLSHIADNWRTMLFGSPFVEWRGEVRLQEFGFSMFLSCPALICGLVWLIRDAARRRLSREKFAVAAMGALNLLLLMMHRTVGAHQFGLRYAVELVPYCFAWLLLDPDRPRMTRWEAALLGFGLSFNFIGGCLVHV